MSSIDHWKTELTAYGQTLGVIRGIFQAGETACMPPLLLYGVCFHSRLCCEGQELVTSEEDVFMGNLKRFGKCYVKIDSLVQTVHTFIKGIGKQFGINNEDGRNCTTR